MAAVTALGQEVMGVGVQGIVLRISRGLLLVPLEAAVVDMGRTPAVPPPPLGLFRNTGFLALPTSSPRTPRLLTLPTPLTGYLFSGTAAAKHTLWHLNVIHVKFSFTRYMLWTMFLLGIISDTKRIIYPGIHKCLSHFSSVHLK